MRFPATYKTLKYNKEREYDSRDNQIPGYGVARARGSNDDWGGSNDWGRRHGSGYMDRDRGENSAWWQGNWWNSWWDECDWRQDPNSRRDPWSS